MSNVFIYKLMAKTDNEMSKTVPSDLEKWYERLNWILEETGTKRARLAEAANVQRSGITNWLAGASETIDAAKLLAMCDYCNASIRWVATGQGQPFLEKSEGFQAASCINGDTIFTMPEKNIINWRVENERTFEPRIKEGDYLFIKTTDTALVSPQLYLFKDKESGHILLRRYYMNMLDKTCALLDGLADERRPDTFKLYSRADFDQILSTFEVVGRATGCYTARI